MVGQSCVVRYTNPFGGIRGVRPPVRSTAGTRQRDRFFESRRREQPFVAHLRDSLLPRGALFGGQDERVHVVRRHRLPRERRRNRRIRLRRPRLLARHVALRHRALFDGPERLAGDAIEHEQETLFGRLRDGVDRLAVVANRDQLWGGVVVVVPQIVVHHLKMPQASFRCVHPARAGSCRRGCCRCDRRRSSRRSASRWGSRRCLAFRRP